MSDKTYPVLRNFELVDIWNAAALVYKYGNIDQQALKLYRHAGELCEGVQKMHHLDAAAAAGKFVTALVGVTAFAGICPDELDEIYQDAGVKATPRTPQQAACDLVRATTTMVHDLNHWLSPAGGTMARAIAISAICEVFCVLKQNASVNGFILDRCIENATTVLMRKTGKLNELGQFCAEPEPTDTVE